MDIQKLITDYAAWLKAEITVADFGEYAELTMPFLDRFNDYLQIYVKQDADGAITLTDDGYIIGNLISFGISLKKGTHLRSECNRIADKFNVSIVNEDITTTATINNFPQKKHMMVQAMLAIDGLADKSIENARIALCRPTPKSLALSP